MRATYLHYENGKGYDVIDFIKDYNLNFNRGNIIKYTFAEQVKKKVN